MRNKRPEDQLKITCADWLKLQHPHLVWNMSWDNIRMTIGQAKKIKRITCEHKYPDFYLAYPARRQHIQKPDYFGMFLEFKKNRSEVFGKKGMYLRNAHLKAQREVLENLYGLGYYTNFCWSFDMFKYIIDHYIKNKPLSLNIYSQTLDDYWFAGF